MAVCNQSIAHVRRAGSEGKHSTRDVYLANKTAVLFVVNLWSWNNFVWMTCGFRNSGWLFETENVKVNNIEKAKNIANHGYDRNS